MSVLNIIVGILLVIGGFSCMFTPFATFLSAGYYIAILLLVYGVFGLVRYFKKESGVLDLVVSILAVVVGIVCLVRPGKTLVIDSLVLTLVAVWMLIQGLVTIIMAFTVLGEQKGWFWGVIVGALLQGDLAYGGVLQQMIARKIDVTKVKKPLFEIDYSDFFHEKANLEFAYEL